MSTETSPKVCKKCLQSKNSTEFYSRYAVCKICCRDRARVNLTPQQRFVKNLRVNYGITEEYYWNLLKEQDNKCAICGLEWNPSSKKFAVDHDHNSNVIRGLLCMDCNTGLGKLGDSLEGLSRAINYLLSRTMPTRVIQAPFNQDLIDIRNLFDGRVWRATYPPLNLFYEGSTEREAVDGLLPMIYLSGLKLLEERAQELNPDFSVSKILEGVKYGEN